MVAPSFLSLRRFGDSSEAAIYVLFLLYQEIISSPSATLRLKASVSCAENIVACCPLALFMSFGAWVWGGERFLSDGRTATRSHYPEPWTGGKGYITLFSTISVMRQATGTLR